VRKGSALLLQAQKHLTWRRHGESEYAALPPVLANSFPKSGTHLLDQIVAGLPGRVNYGAFLSSETSSFQYRLRSPESTHRYIQGSLPGEIVRAHLFFADEYDESLEQLNFVHYFIYRDPRDVVVSTALFLRHMYPWHRLSRPTRALPSDEEAILMFIEGTDGGGPDALLSNINLRFQRYEGWISCPHVCAVRFEDLVGPESDDRLAALAKFYAARATTPLDVPEMVGRLKANIAPEKSHTFRQGKKGGWREAFTPRLTDAFKSVANDLLVRLGYERDDVW
jgi:hypothetical protein